MTSEGHDARLLLVVQDVFAISGRGTVLMPPPDVASAGHLEVELRRPDGSNERVQASVYFAFLRLLTGGSATQYEMVLQIPTERVPIGTEVWSAGVVSPLPPRTAR